MGRLAIIGGHAILGTEPVEGLEAQLLETEHGTAEVMVGERRVLVQRHGYDPYRTASRINHRANLAALDQLGCDRILAIGSVGSLREDLAVGTVLVPDDFIALHLGISFSDAHGGERVPAFDPTWRERVIEAWRRHAERPLVEGGVYWQAIGPRFETAAEVRLISSYADVVGMTIASECILAGELGISYAAVCVVDNLANGIAGAPLAVEDFEAGKSLNRPRLLASLGGAIESLGGGG